MIPIFSTHYSGNSILTLDDPEEYTAAQKKRGEQTDLTPSNEAISVFGIAQKHGLNEVFVADSSFAGFVRAYSVSKKYGIKLRFGIKLWVCQYLPEKSDFSTKTESKIIIWILNSDGYADLIKIYNKSYSVDSFYYHNRIDWKTLSEMITPNLGVSVDFYDGFLAKNLIGNHFCVPSLPTVSNELDFWICDMGLPFDGIIQQATLEFIKNNGSKIKKVHPVYYYKTLDSDAYQAYRCIKNRSTLEKPELDHFSSDKFSFEEYLTKTKI